MKKLKKTFAWLMIAFVLFTSFASLNMHPTSVKAEDAPESWAFYRITSAAANYMSAQIAPNEKGNNTTIVEGLSGMTAGQAGLFLGYPDPDSLGDKLSAWLASIVSRASLTYSYQSIKTVPDGSDEGSAALYQYARYGSLLQSLGFDEAKGMGSNIMRNVVAFPFFVSYHIADSARGIMNFGLNTLQALNPFKFMAVERTVTLNTGYTEHYADGSPVEVTGSETYSNETQVSILNGAVNLTEDDALYPIAEFYSNIYQTIYAFSWVVVIPVIFAVFVAGLLLKKDSAKMPRIKRYVLRIAFIVIGIPLLGVLYTSALTSMGEAVEDGASPVAAVVGSTFIDFGSWAEHSNLLPYRGTYFASRSSSSAPGGSPTPITLADIRKSALVININSGALNSLKTDNWLNQLGQDVSVSSNQFAQTFGFNAGLQTVRQTNVEVSTLLSKYSSGARYDPAMKETSVKNELMKGAGVDEAKRKAITEMFKQTSAWSSWEAGDAAKSIQSSSDASEYSIFHGDLIAYHQIDEEDDREKELTGYDFMKFRPDGADSKKGLSDIAMYNYLNSSFGPQSVVVYSPNDSSSLFTRDTHYAVNMVGRGMVAFALTFNSFAMLLVYGVIGWGYAILMIFKNIKRTFTFLVRELPWAMLGGIKAIGEVIVTVSMMAIEILMTVFLYVMLTQFLYVFPTIVGQSLYNIFGGGTTEAVLIMGWLVSAIFLLWFMFMAFKVRKDVIKGLDEGAIELVRKLVNTDDIGAKPEGPGALARGAAAGAGMALGNRMVSGDMKRPGDDKMASGQQTEMGQTQDGVSGADGTGSDGSDGDNGAVIGGGGDKPRLSGGPGSKPGGPGSKPGGPGSKEVATMSEPKQIGVSDGSSKEETDTKGVSSGDTVQDGSPMLPAVQDGADFDGGRDAELQEQREAQAMMAEGSLDASASDIIEMEEKPDGSYGPVEQGSDDVRGLDTNVAGGTGTDDSYQLEESESSESIVQRPAATSASGAQSSMREEKQIEETSEKRQTTRRVSGSGSQGGRSGQRRSGGGSGQKRIGTQPDGQGKASSVKGTQTDSRKTAKGVSSKSSAPTQSSKPKTLSPMQAAILASAAGSDSQLAKSVAQGAGMAYAGKVLQSKNQPQSQVVEPERTEETVKTTIERHHTIEEEVIEIVDESNTLDQYTESDDGDDY